MYRIIFSETADAQFSKLDKPVKERITKALERLRFTPQTYITKLVGQPGYKFRVGDYRVILDIIQNELVVLVIKIGHRSTIYER